MKAAETSVSRHNSRTAAGHAPAKNAAMRSASVVRVP